MTYKIGSKLLILVLFFLAVTSSFAGNISFDEERRAEKISFDEEKYAEKVSFDEERFVDKIISSSGLNFRSKHFEEMTVDELKDRYEGEYDIDWSSIIAKFGAGTAIIVVTGTVSVVAGAVGAEPIAVLALAAARGAATGCISGAAVGGGLRGLIDGIKTKNISNVQKEVIYGAADGCMWGAFVGAITGGLVKSGKNNPSKLKNESMMGTKTIGQDIQSPNSIPKNATYQVNGYIENGAKYTTDEYARIKKFSANLRKTNANPRGSNGVEQRIGHQMKCGVGGHLIANQFGGTGGYENLVPMSASVNSGAYKALENKWSKALKEGKKVSVTGEILYNGISSVPVEFIINYFVDGVAKPEVRIQNTCP